MTAVTILVADDDELIRRLLKFVLAGAGYDVQLASDGDELVQLARTATPTLILTDLSMPVLDGVAAIRQLRDEERTASVPIIALSACFDLEHDARDAGATAFLLKPFSLDDLLARIAALLSPAHP